MKDVINKPTLARKPKHNPHYFAGFRYLIPDQKPTSFTGKKLEYARDCYAISYKVLSHVIKRYFRLLVRAPILVLTPGSISSALESYSHFNYIDKFLIKSIFHGNKLVHYCLMCDFHDHKEYTYDCDFDFWELSETTGEGICMQCAGKTQQDLLELDEDDE